MASAIRKLYQNLVDATLRFLIEQVGGRRRGVQGRQHAAGRFLVRRTAGNAVEALGIVAFRASPVWILAALADLCGMGRHLIPEIADALKAQGLLEADAQFVTRRSDARRPGNAPRRGWPPPSTRRRSTSRDCATNGRRFAPKRGRLRPPACPAARRSPTSGRS
jgi:hypothetical protein